MSDRYGQFPFSPALLAEDVDLSVSTRKEILFLYERLDRLDHWQVLGVPWNAPPPQVRAAYLEKVKLFHPDRHAGRRLGSFLPKIERVFRALTEARDVLMDDARRAAYVRKTASPEDFARLEAQQLEEEARAQERRARLCRANPLVARAARVSELVRRGKSALDEGRYSQAANDFQTVLGLDPRHSEARGLADTARARAVAERAQTAYEAALKAEATGKVSDALAGFREAAQADPKVARYAVAASRLALQSGDLGEARQFAESAVRAGPREGRSLEALGAVLFASGETKEARRALERALDLDPQLETARGLMKKMRWSFLS